MEPHTMMFISKPIQVLCVSVCAAAAVLLWIYV